MRKGVFIVFEGIDGSGKSSCMAGVASELEKDHNVAVTAEPTKSEIGMLIRSSPDVTAEAEALLFAADRAQHTQQIKEWMEDGRIVLCDRYYASTLAYQSANLNGRSADIRWLTDIHTGVIIRPDLTLLFDIDPEIGLERIAPRGEVSKFERLEYLKEVRKNYLVIAEKDRFKVMDASRTKEEVLVETMKHISETVSRKSK
ncbi:MAG: dTMP kinase [Methanomassiliicoccaceae archaeon]|nr:dTMP kinase [Methanomassiliicoccaceae archaeon]